MFLCVYFEILKEGLIHWNLWEIVFCISSVQIIWIKKMSHDLAFTAEFAGEYVSRGVYLYFLLFVFFNEVHFVLYFRR